MKTIFKTSIRHYYDIFVPGSLNSRAVAGTLPEFTPRVELNTEIATAFGNPAANGKSSDAVAAFYNKFLTS